METRRLTDRAADIAVAAEILRAGGLVAFPTETVYGLGANALDREAAGKVYTAKGRPSDNPMIVHIAETAGLRALTADITEDMERLMERFWPGPMTMIVPRLPVVPDVTTGGLNTVGVRMPAHPAALALIREAGVPIAAPSANTSGRPSPTTASHVLHDLDGRIDAVICSTDCQVGIESTVIDMTGETPMILRPGILTAEEFAEVLGKPVALDPTLNRRPDPADGADWKPKAPGMKYKHYAPRAEMTIFAGTPEAVTAAIAAEQARLSAEGKTVRVLRLDLCDQRQAARSFFAQLRDADAEGCDAILAAALPEEGIGFSVMNRMLKSAGFHIRQV